MGITAVELRVNLCDCITLLDGLTAVLELGTVRSGDTAAGERYTSTVSIHANE